MSSSCSHAFPPHGEYQLGSDGSMGHSSTSTSTSTSTTSWQGGTMSAIPGGSFKPKHFNEGVRSEAWLDAEIPLPSLYSPRPEESLTPTAPVTPVLPATSGARTPSRPTPSSPVLHSASVSRTTLDAPRYPTDRAPSPLGRELPQLAADEQAGRNTADPEAEVDVDAADAVDPELRAQVEKDAPAFLAKVADVQNSRAVLQTLLDSTADLQGKAQRLRAKLVTPYESLRTLQTDLIRLQLGTELLRRAARFESLRWQLDDDIHLVQGERPLARHGGHPVLPSDETQDKPVTEEERARALARAAFTSNEMIQDFLRAQLDPEPERVEPSPARGSIPGGPASAPIGGAFQARSQQENAPETPRTAVLSFGKRLEEFRQRMGRADAQHVSAQSMYY
ncbi:Conserved oligomeric Golgi complex subunit [Tilletia horrida]|nr:Conserved oligomeric Golgi complex subunit [Tilletia horrida]